MKRKSKRLFTAQTMREGVGHIATLQKKAQEFVPPSQEPVPTHDGYCIRCKGKKTFPIEATETMKNKALRHSGTCPDCGTKMSGFASGVKDANG
jgi:hypothetical protein